MDCVINNFKWCFLNLNRKDKFLSLIDIRIHGVLVAFVVI